MRPVHFGQVYFFPETAHRELKGLISNHPHDNLDVGDEAEHTDKLISYLSPRIAEDPLQTDTMSFRRYPNILNDTSSTETEGWMLFTDKNEPHFSDLKRQIHGKDQTNDREEVLETIIQKAKDQNHFSIIA